MSALGRRELSDFTEGNPLKTLERKLVPNTRDWEEEAAKAGRTENFKSLEILLHIFTNIFHMFYYLELVGERCQAHKECEPPALCLLDRCACPPGTFTQPEHPVCAFQPDWPPSRSQ
jgi:hypothetical protein